MLSSHWQARPQEVVSSTLVGEENCGVVRANSSRAHCHLNRNVHWQTSVYQGGKSASDILTFVYRISIRKYRYFRKVGYQEQSKASERLKFLF
jgi:hypothetical protein